MPSWLARAEQLLLLAHFPVECMIFEEKVAYYQTLNTSTQQKGSAPLIEFMLAAIASAVEAFG